VEWLLARVRPRRLVAGLVGLWVLLSAAWTVRDYFFVWPQEPEVEFVWQTALRDAAAALDADPSAAPVVIGGWTPASMDPPSMELFLRRDDLDLRYVDPTQALVLPAGGGRMVWPAILPLAAELDGFLVERGGEFGVAGRTRWVELPPSGPPGRDYVVQELVFTINTTLQGYQLLPAGDGFSLLTFWRASGPIDEPLAIFIHLLDAGGQIVAQYDGLGAPADHWRAGDTVVVLHRMPVLAGAYIPRLGLYNPENGQRYAYSSSLGMADTLDLNRVVVP
jgi:hypothetical protein